MGTFLPHRRNLVLELIGGVQRKARDQRHPHNPPVAIAKFYKVADIVATADERFEEPAAIAVVVHGCEVADILVADRSDEAVALMVHACPNKAISKTLRLPGFGICSLAGICFELSKELRKGSTSI